MTEASHDRRIQRQRERRARRREGKALRAAVLAADGDLDAFIGLGSEKRMMAVTRRNRASDDWHDEQEEGQEDGE